MIDTPQQQAQRDQDEVARAQTKVLKAVKDELNAQLDKWGVQSHSLPEWASIEMEEVGEASADGNKAYWLQQQIDRLNFKMISSDNQYWLELGREWDEKVAKKNAYLDAARQEWIQVAAVAVAIVESIDRQRAAGSL